MTESHDFARKPKNNIVKPLPSLFQFISGRNPKLNAEVEPAREAPKSRGRSGRPFLVAVRAPNDQLHVVAIPSCGWDEFSEPDSTSVVLATFVPDATPTRDKRPCWTIKAEGVGQTFLPCVAGVLAFFAKK
jgi:hypothetical protein